MPDSFEMNLKSGSVEKAIKAAGGTASKLHMIPLAAIHTIDGFNVREGSKDYTAHIHMLRDSMIANGFMRDQPLSGVVVLDEDGENRIYVIGGHSRLAAAHLVAADPDQASKVTPVPIVLKPGTFTTRDLVKEMWLGNAQRDLTPLEKAHVVQRMSLLGDDDKTIASTFGITVRYVNDLMALLGAGAAVHKMVANGKVSATEAIRVVRQHGDDALSVLKGAAITAEADAKAKGKSADSAKVTAKTTDKAAKAAGKDVKPKGKASKGPEVTIAKAEKPAKPGKKPPEDAPIAGDMDFAVAAMAYAIHVLQPAVGAEAALDFLDKWRLSEEAESLAVEVFMGQPKGATEVVVSRVPLESEAVMIERELARRDAAAKLDDAAAGL